MSCCCWGGKRRSIALGWYNPGPYDLVQTREKRDRSSGRTPCGDGRALDQVSRMQRTPLEEGPGKQSARLPEMQLSLQDIGIRAYQPAHGFRLGGARRLDALDRSAGIQSQQAIQRQSGVVASK